MAKTIVALHAHPDDEALLTGGTLARASAEGNRVVLVVATDGELGQAAAGFAHGGLSGTRMHELGVSAAALGIHRVIHLGYADSGLGDDLYADPPGRVRFCRADPQQAAGRVEQILRAERADLLLGYDAHGGYGHRDHVRVHEVARIASTRTGIRLLEATIPRDTICRGIDLAAKVYRFPPEFDRSSFDRTFSARADITHRVNVVRYAAQKRAAMAAHASQASADGDADRTLAAFLRIPRPLYDLVFGREWFSDPQAPRGAPVQPWIL